MASTSSNVTEAPPPDESLVLFARGVIARLATWQTLRLAVDEAWGGPESVQKRTWMASVIVDAFDPSQSQEMPDAIYLEEMLLQIMADEFDAILEDGSAEIVARDIVKLWQMKVTEDRFKDAILAWEDQADKVKGKKVLSRQAVQDDEEVDEDSDGWEDDDGDGDGDSDEAPQLLSPRTQLQQEEPQVDEEGFTMVTKKVKGHR